MGAPKQKWTVEEEAALKAGVVKHGAGKWRTILTDPEFRAILHLRSNVDLKDKWRNINVTAIWGSRQKAKLALKRNLPAPKHDDNVVALSTVSRSEEEIIDAKPLAITSGTVKVAETKEPLARLDKLISQAISSLKEPRGSDRAAIAMYIQEHYWAPPNLMKLLSTKLKHMTSNGKLIKVKNRYRVAPSSAFLGKKRSPILHLEGKHKDLFKAEKNKVNGTAKQVSPEFSRTRRISLEEAAAVAARAVAEAEAAIAEAEQAAREAEAAEAEAEAAQIFAQAAMEALKSSTLLAC